jgi:hypothetical protein
MGPVLPTTKTAQKAPLVFEVPLNSNCCEEHLAISELN